MEFCEYDIDLRNSPRTKSASDCYDIVVAVRHTEKYPFADLFLSLSSTPGLPLPSELRMAITGSSGGWLGRGALGVYTVTDTLARHIILPDSACLRIGQSMHRDKVPGILDVGVIITRSTP